MKFAEIFKTIGGTIKQYSPEILLGVGFLAGGAAIFTASKATLKATSIMEEHKNGKKEIEDALNLENENYTKEDAKKDNLKLTFNTGLKMAKNYALPFGLALLSGTAFTFAYKIPTTREAKANAKLAAAASATNLLIDRIREEYGEEKLYSLLTGAKTEKIEETDPETGKKTKKEALVVDENAKNVGSFIYTFDRSSSLFSDIPIYNEQTIEQYERYFKDQVVINGSGTIAEFLKQMDVEFDLKSMNAGYVRDANGESHVKIVHRQAYQRHADGSLEPIYTFEFKNVINDIRPVLWPKRYKNMIEN